ncbi:hypothetical protein [Clostridium polynesiense]|uniref:hypothetical protein n=1 Tax=Clostridium polynesiense TaxID=1325933 RepID=UPI00058D662E|nr:hypothetical protein [Clostridium polynesiense]
MNINAIGALFILFVILSLFGAAGTLLLFTVKSEKASDILMIVMALFAILIAFLSSSGQPDNYVLQRIIAWGIGLLSLGGLIFRFIFKKPQFIDKLLIALSVIVGLLYLFS